ncbi:hypothetical protein UCDDS831_g01474 [Diplodia seriata]|uniref:Lysine-specific metallo-endopeptidase domain-containing protein n=1 Tax=Diplodia seriata TaxID=420778 RepID=A0A0G2EW33_9PEZI|nr:hypothetical protein UCDDS831_g01474 [Diplodia seriata]
MSFLKALTLVVLALSQFTHAIPYPTHNPHEARKQSSLEPSPGSNSKSNPEKRSIFNVDRIPDTGEKAALTQGLKDAVAVAKMALAKMDDDKHKDKVTQWFGPSADHPPVVKQVFQNFVGGATNELGPVVVWDVDYGRRGGRPFCLATDAQGRKGTAYFWPRRGRPGMHFCPKFFGRKNARDYVAGGCGNVSANIDTETVGRAFQGANVLHEFMHYDKVGLEAVGEQIGDFAYGAYDCFDLQNDRVKLGSRKTTENADNYVYFAMHIWLTETCGRDFAYPRGEEDN